MSLLNALRQCCHQLGTNKTYWIAYSGGLDSQVLLMLCHQLRTEIPLNLVAIHINHGLSQHAMTWQAHCVRTCNTLKIELITHQLTDLNPNANNLEETARNLRYQFFAECLAQNDVLLTAHHQDDQAETVLLQLLRGAGVKGLAAMPHIKLFAKGHHARPLLNFSREQLHRYANANELQWIDDESNQNQHFTRNFFRQQILPLLKQRWPTATKMIARSASHCAEAQQLLNEHAQIHLLNLRGSQPNTLSIARLLELSYVEQRSILRYWINQLGYPVPDATRLTAIQNNALRAAKDRMPQVFWNGIEVRRFRDDLYIMPRLAQHNIQQVFNWDFSPLSIPGVGHLKATRLLGNGLRADLSNLSIRFRQGGETVWSTQRGTQTLKNLFQEWRIPSWLRPRLPLIFSDNKLISVVGYFLDEEARAKANEWGYDIKLQPE